jgi:hypothetical protein
VHMVHDDDTGSDPDFDIESADRASEYGEPHPIPDHILEVIHEKALHGGWEAERIQDHLARFFNTHIPLRTIRYIVDQVRRNQ